MRRLILLLLPVFFVLAAAFPAAAASFVDVRPGPRPMAMGMAYTAVADGPYGMFYNPAGTARSDFAQLGATMGRMISPAGLVALEAFAYTRPLPILPGATVGAAFFSAQESEINAERNEFLLHFSHAIKVPRLYLRRRLKVGGNFKILQATAGRGELSKVGIGLDGGVLFDSGHGWKAGLALMDLTTGIGVPTPGFSLGASYRWRRRVTFVSDLNIRIGHMTQLLPGVEVDFFQRLLKVRIGRGLPLDAMSQFAFGLGINFSPVILDVGMTIPFNGINRRGGAYQLAVVYKFGAPPFTGRFVGEAAREAEDIRADILELENKRKDFKSQSEAAEAEKTGLQGVVQSQEGRLRELREQIRALERRIEDKRYQDTHAAPAAPPQPPIEAAPAAKPRPKAGKRGRARRRRGKPRPSRFPLRHKVLPGDTLRRLAERYYGDNTLWELIYDANPDKVERGLPIEGAVLLIPPRKK